MKQSQVCRGEARVRKTYGPLILFWRHWLGRHTKNMVTLFDSKVEILAEFMAEYSKEERFAEFVRQENIGLPLAWLLHNDFATDFSPEGREFINHSFRELLKWLDLEDTGFASLADLQVPLTSPCSQCGAKLGAADRFCTGCGTPTPTKEDRNGGHLTTQELLAHLRKEAKDLDGLHFKQTCTFPDNRSQDVFVVLEVDQDGDTEFDEVSLYSYFAPENFNPEAAVAAVDGRWFGVTNDGGDGGFQLVTSLRIETLTSLGSFDQYVYWLGRQADSLEEELTATDHY